MLAGLDGIFFVLFLMPVVDVVFVVLLVVAPVDAVLLAPPRSRSQAP
jgi:hypothetical protein